jgi:hypothetical protein
MRKLLWGGVAMLVFGATSVFIAADHAQKHPDSLVARVGRAAVCYGLTANPVAALNTLNPPQDAETLPAGMVQVDAREVLPPELPPCDDDPIQETEEPDPVNVINNVPHHGDFARVGIEFGESGPRYYGRTPEQDTEDTHSYVIPGIDYSMPAMPEVSEDDGVRDVEPTDPLIPQVRDLRLDNIDLLEDGQATFTPRVDGVVMSGIQSIFEACSRMHAFDGRTEMFVPFFGRVCVPSVVECLRALPQGCEEMDLFGLMRGMMDGFRADQLVPGGEEQCEPEGTPAYHWLFRVLGLERMFEPTPEPMTESDPMSTENEAQEEMPMRDPDFHRYHYQGCPYSGCPYSGRTYPQYEPPTPAVTPEPTPDQSEPQTRTHHRRHGCGTGGDSCWSFWQRLFSGRVEGGSDGVDTMECRPTDVQFDLRRLMPF